MNIDQASKLLNQLGKLTEVNNKQIEEIASPFENYHKLIKNGEIWEFGLFMVERQNNNYFKPLKQFSTESEGAKYFFLNRLSAYYFAEKISPFIMNHSQYDIGGPSFSEKKLLNAMSLLGIPSTLLSLDLEHKNRAIKLKKVDELNFTVSYVDSKGNTVKSTIPMDYQRALFITFKKVFLLHLFEYDVSRVLEAEGIRLDFSDEDINVFLT